MQPVKKSVRPAHGEKRSSRAALAIAHPARVGTAPADRRGGRPAMATPDLRSSLDDVIRIFVRGAPLERIDAERAGLDGVLVKDLASRLGIANKRMFEVIGVPKATAEKRAASNAAIAGAPGQAALGMVRLLGVANAIVADSTAEAARGFDTAKWLGRWIEVPQPALGGRKPADVLDTPTGVDTVAKLLGAIESGVYL
jgi:putative toxin-antitoxin system antitoxin component (TIGR02293 family)